MFDLLSTVELTVSAFIVLGTLAYLWGVTVRQRIGAAAALAAWFVAVLWLGASDALHHERGAGVVALAAAILLPVIVLTALALGTETGRRAVSAAPLPVLIGIQAVRVLGISFVLLYVAERLPAPFAPVAGWGDILVGALALPVALAAARYGERARNTVMLWNLLGLADLVAAVGLGATSSPGPIRVFMDEPGSAMMTSVPWIIIPCFLVPALTTVHLVTLHKLRRPREASALAFR